MEYKINTTCCGKQTIKLIGTNTSTSNEQDIKMGEKKQGSQKTVDIIVVGSGMAGTMAMISAVKEGSEVIMLEAESSLGGTSLLSGNHLWFLNLSKTKAIALALKNLNIPLIGDEYNNLPGGFDIKNGAMKYMASCAFPELYNENKKYYGMPADVYEWLEFFYDKGADVFENEILPYIDSLRIQYNSIKGTNHGSMIYDTNMNPLSAGFTLEQLPNQTFVATKDDIVPGSFGTIPGYCYAVNDTPGYMSMEPDYFDKKEKPGTCVGREITFYENQSGVHLNISDGGEWMKRVWEYLRVVKNQQLLTNKRVIDVKEEEEYIIVTAYDNLNKMEIQYKAKKGVIFASGGFSHNNDLLVKNLPFTKILGTCSSNGCRGDLVDICEKNKWPMTQMRQAFYNQRLLNNIGTTTPSIMWFNWFTTCMVINKYGKRVYSETAKYNERARVHFSFDAETGTYPNQYLFMVLDRLEYEIYKNPAFAIGTLANAKTFSVNDMSMSMQDKINNICGQIKSWFGSLTELSEFEIDDNKMASGFYETLNRYYGFCRTGIDSDFSKQNNDSTRHFMGYVKSNIDPTFTKNTPVTESNDWRYNNLQIYGIYGPNAKTYYDEVVNPSYEYTYPSGNILKICPDILLQPIIDPVVMVLTPCTLDTKGGPVCSKDMKISYSKGCYVTGNAGGNAFTGSGYFGAGATLGPALFQGWIAGKSASNNDYSSNNDDKFSDNLKVVSLMDNQYPDKTIALQFSDPISINFVSSNFPNNTKILFKLSGNRNEYIPKDVDVTNIIGWSSFNPTILNTEEDISVVKIILPGGTFTTRGNYLLSFQMIKNNKSLGPKYATQNEISITQFNNIDNYSYLGNNLPTGSLLLVQDGGSWTGKFRAQTTSGFPECTNNNNIYIQYRQPSHNFNLAYAFQFDSLQDVQTFSNFVYSKGNNESWDGAAMSTIAANYFNFTFNPSPPPSTLPNVVIVAALDLGYFQPSFASHYDVQNNGITFPRNEVSTYSYISTIELTKNWYFNKSLTQTGKYTVYFYFCMPHRQSSSHYGWFLVKP